MEPIDRVRWLVEPAPWRGLKVSFAAGAAFCVLGALGFVLPPMYRPFVISLAFVAWVIGGAGMIGHFRWWWKRGREGKIGFNDD